MPTPKRVRIDTTMLQGAVSCVQGPEWIQPWRLPYEELALFPPQDGLVARAEMAAGVRLRFSTDSAVVGVVMVPGSAPVPVDVTIAGELVGSGVLPSGADRVLFEGLPAAAKEVEIWFGQTSVVRLCDVLIEEGASLSVPRDSRLRWITYGSSISHCGGAAGPARTWPAVAARLRGLSLTCLGFGGQCHIDPMVARLIRDLPADAISLKLGINVQGGSSLSPRTFAPAIIGMVRIIREKHPLIPLAVISPIISPPRETTPNAVGLSLSRMRVEVADAVKRLQDCGDGHVHYVDGLRLFDAAWVADCLPDQLHPNAEGYQRLGQRFVDVVVDPIFLACHATARGPGGRFVRSAP